MVYSFEPINLCLSFNSVVTWTKKIFWSSSWCKNYHSLLFFALKQRKLSKHVCSTTNQTRNFCLALIQAVSNLCIIRKENWCFFLTFRLSTVRHIDYFSYRLVWKHIKVAACDWSNMSRCYFRLTGSPSNARTLCFLSEIVIIIIILLLSGEICPS